MIQIGNGNWAVKEDNLLGFRYDETEGVYFPREMTFGRACDATRVNPDGLIERVPYNLVQYSNTFSNGAWTKLNVTQASGQIGYDGSSNAWLTSFTAGSTRAFGPNIAQTGVVTYSIFAKAGTHNFIQLTSSTSSSIYVNYNISATNASVGNQGAGVVGASIESIGNDWYRCSITFDNTASSTMWLWIVNSNTSARASAVSTDGNFLVQAAQAVEGTTAKPYFPTTNRQDIARIDYSSGTGALLLEPQRTNLVTYDTPSNFSAAVPRWTNGTSNPAVINQAVGIYGTETATKYTKTPGNTSADYLYFQQVPVVSGSVYTVSGYIKLGTASNAVVVINNTTAWDSVGGANFVATASGGYNQWKRFEITFTAPASNKVNIHFGYHMETGVAAQADGTFFIQGVQLELGSYATSIIQTNGTTVTRLADSCYKTGVADWIGQTEGTLFAEVNLVAGSTEFKVISVSDGGTNNRAIIVANAQSDLRSFCVYGGTVGTAISTSIPTGKIKMAIVYTASNYTFFVNGSKIGTQSKSTFGASLTRIGTDQGNGGNSFFGTSNQIQLYKTPLSDSEAIALTTI